MKILNWTAWMFAIVIAFSSPLRAINWKDSLEADLQSHYILSTVSKLTTQNITKPGTVVVAKVDGITSGMPTKVIDGVLKPPGGLTQASLKAEDKHTFRSGDRFYVTNIVVSDDNVKFVLDSADAANVDRAGNTIQRRWILALEFDFPKDYLQKMDAAKLMPAIEAILQTETQAAAVHTKTIHLGQSKSDVESILGKPETVAELGAKTIYSYKSMKVIFMDGKVSDVQ